MPSRSWELDLCSRDLQRNIRHDAGGRLSALAARQQKKPLFLLLASGLATTTIRALREAGVDSQAPLRMLARSFLGRFLSGGARTSKSESPP